jgi:hypothetical protein
MSLTTTIDSVQFNNVNATNLFVRVERRTNLPLLFEDPRLGLIVRHCGRASIVGTLPILPFLRPQYPPSLAPDCQRVAQRRGGVPLGF